MKSQLATVARLFLPILLPFTMQTMFVIAERVTHYTELIEWLTIFTSVSAGAVALWFALGVRYDLDQRVTFCIAYIPVMGSLLWAYSFFVAQYVFRVGGP